VGRIVDGDQSRRRICQTSMTSTARKENRQHMAYVRPACCPRILFVGPACRAGLSPEGELWRDARQPIAIRQDQYPGQTKSRQVAKSFPAERTYFNAFPLFPSLPSAFLKLFLSQGQWNNLNLHLTLNHNLRRPHLYSTRNRLPSPFK
jgi:hypothetical protein